VGAAVHQQKKDGYSGYNSSQNGFLVGGSVDVAPELTVGVYGGWTAGQYSAQGVKADIDSRSTHLGAFFRFKGQGEAQGVLVTGDIAYSASRNDSSRAVPLLIGNQRMEADYGQYVIGGGLEVAYDYVPPGDEYSRVTPFVAVRYSHLSQDGYTESGGLPLKVDSMDNDQFASTVGVRAARDFVVADDRIVVTPRVSAAWVHNWSNDRFLARSRFVGSPVSFDTRSVPLDRDAVQLGAGLDLRFKQDAGWDFGVKAAYGVDLRASSTAHNFFGGFEVNF
jgi:outer membrane autotransporter protein